MMASERIQCRIDSLLDEADQAIAHEDWSTVASRARSVLKCQADFGVELEPERGLFAVTHGVPPGCLRYLYKTRQAMG